MAKQKHRCVDCGAEFPNLAQLTKHKQECPAAALRNMQDDDPAQSDRKALADGPTAAPAGRPVEVLGQSESAPSGKRQASAPIAVIPWGTRGVASELRALSSTTPIWVQVQVYPRDDGLHVAEVQTNRRR